MNKISMKDRILGGIIGFCVADALGVPVEFMSRKTLVSNPVTDMRGYGTYSQPPGTWSDDTSMVLCYLDGFDKQPSFYYDLMDKYVSWMMNADYTPYDEVFDIGNTTRVALMRWANKSPGQFSPSDSDPFIGPGGTSENDNGNGALMRILPEAFHLNYRNKESTHGHLQFAEKLVLRNIHSLVSMTHNTNRSFIACTIYIFIAERLISSESINDAFHNGLRDVNDCINAEQHVYNGNDSFAELSHFARIFDDGFANLPEESIKSSGYVVDTLEAALWCLLNTNDYASCVLKAVNLGGDTDTVAAVAGGLAGIHYGFDTIPENWVSNIAKIDYIKDLCAKFSEKMHLYDAISQ